MIGYVEGSARLKKPKNRIICPGAVASILGRSICEFFDFGQLRHRAWIHDRIIPYADPWHGRRRCVHIWCCCGIARASNPWLDRDVSFTFRRYAAASGLFPGARAAISLHGTGHDPPGIDRFPRRPAVRSYKILMRNSATRRRWPGRAPAQVQTVAWGC